MSASTIRIPSFSELPLRKDDPPHSAWGLYGEDDQLGTLNRLTDETVLRSARDEIRSGFRISLNWPLDSIKKPLFERLAFQHEIIRGVQITGNDDIWTLNPQSSSQWDGLRHFAYMKERKFYNGVAQEDIHGEHKTNINGIQAWAEKGIVGRGVLLDFHSWRLAHNVPDDPFQTETISLAQLKAVAESQGTEIRFGDILIIRSGYIAGYKKHMEENSDEHTVTHLQSFSGVEQSDEMLEWIWNNFSAVAGDQPAFERWPPQKEWLLHEILLSGWGCPIGELFDLERLAEHCMEIKRWSFFVSSEVCNVPGGVASPPNILAIF